MHRRQSVLLSSASTVAALLSTAALAASVSPEEKLQPSATALSNGNVKLFRLEVPRAQLVEPLLLPAGVHMFPDEKVRISRRWAEPRFAKLVHFDERPKDGHFTALEHPTAFVNEVWAEFREVQR